MRPPDIHTTIRLAPTDILSMHLKQHPLSSLTLMTYFAVSEMSTPSVPKLIMRIEPIVNCSK
jgi:hypothetical protein